MDWFRRDDKSEFTLRRQNEIFIEDTIIKSFGSEGKYFYKALINNSALFFRDNKTTDLSLFSFKLLTQILNNRQKQNSIQALINFLTKFEVVISEEGVWFEPYTSGYISPPEKQSEILRRLENLKNKTRG